MVVPSITRAVGTGNGAGREHRALVADRRTSLGGEGVGSTRKRRGSGDWAVAARGARQAGGRAGLPCAGVVRAG